MRLDSLLSDRHTRRDFKNKALGTVTKFQQVDLTLGEASGKPTREELTDFVLRELPNIYHIVSRDPPGRAPFDTSLIARLVDEIYPLLRDDHYANPAVSSYTNREVLFWLRENYAWSTQAWRQERYPKPGERQIDDLRREDWTGHVLEKFESDLRWQTSSTALHWVLEEIEGHQRFSENSGLGHLVDQELEVFDLFHQEVVDQAISDFIAGNGTFFGLIADATKKIREEAGRIADILQQSAVSELRPQADWGFDVWEAKGEADRGRRFYVSLVPPKGEDRYSAVAPCGDSAPGILETLVGKALSAIGGESICENLWEVPADSPEEAIRILADSGLRPELGGRVWDW